MLRIMVLICTFLLSLPVQAAEFDHGGWGDLLGAHVRELAGGSASQVDYAGFAASRTELKDYLEKLSAVDSQTFDSWAVDEQLAFLINAYNSWTVELVLIKYPDLASIKDLGSFFQSPWQKSFIPLFGKQRSLDEIEHQLIRGSGRYNDPRIHFAVNCASIGCPALRADPYSGSGLQRQLAEATAFFLQDRSRNRLSGAVLEISSIFKWYRKDFEKGWRSVSSLNQFLADHKEDLGLTETEAKQLVAGKIKIKFLDYDWKLNSIL